MKRNKKGFTLAEVLITLSILGVVAAIMIPNMIQKYQDRQTITAVKRAYSILQNALDTAIIEKGPLETWDWPQPKGYYHGDNAKYFARTIMPYLSYSNDCININGYASCASYGWLINGARFFKGLNGHINQIGNGLYSQSSFKLKNGMILYFSSGVLPNGYENNGVYIMVTVDINGKKEPNREGYDVFYFDIHKTKGVLSKRLTWQANSSNNCNKNNTSAYSGTSCSAWVLKHGNLDYKYLDYSNVRAKW